VSATATDGAGHTATDDHELVIDATLPLVDIVAPADMSTTRDARPVISGTASAGATVELVIDGGATVTVTADATGAWSYTPPADLSAGRHTVVATVTIGAATATDAHEFTVDTSAPEIVIVEPADGSRIEMRRPVIRGTATPGAT